MLIMIGDQKSLEVLTATTVMNEFAQKGIGVLLGTVNRMRDGLCQVKVTLFPCDTDKGEPDGLALFQRVQELDQVGIKLFERQAAHTNVPTKRKAWAKEEGVYVGKATAELVQHTQTRFQYAFGF